MYNRYVPQRDGTFQRNAVPEPEPMAVPPCPPPKPPRPTPPPKRPPDPVGGFFRQLLPKDFCTEDLLVVLLLLLMAGDSREEQNFALLTLALYLFL